MKNTVKTLAKKYACIAAALVVTSGCAIAEQGDKMTVNQVLKAGSPWATTAVYLQTDGKSDKSANLIGDSNISKGTISSAQYSEKKFMFIGMSDYTKGTFNQDSLVSSINAVTDSGSKPKGFAHGDYAVVKDDKGSTVRRITNASFAPSKVIDRTVTVATPEEFGYTFNKNGNTYYVEHKPYGSAFPGVTYPAALQTAVESFFAK
ncbi:hypothetical protein [Amphritea balenae]|uniref:Lipoprotein n=1 Tax=Amphritea balenae TaxID=452629 RepID=A0A3P1SWF5_9GAMM|nr:hypothetical protein [Amphritea balenae]RRD01542.1 hypothetical protein EHS89_03015 [Amphritea balenae]GGK56095.1 hypothetical protein GCM10007941_02900 [Amphritea balenae]